MKSIALVMALMMFGCQEDSRITWYNKHYSKVMLVPTFEDLRVVAVQRCSKEAEKDTCVWAYMQGFVDRMKEE